MICPHCLLEGRKSKVFEDGLHSDQHSPNQRTEHWTEEGKHVRKNINVSDWKNHCSNGHEFIKRYKFSDGKSYYLIDGIETPIVPNWLYHIRDRKSKRMRRMHWVEAMLRNPVKWWVGVDCFYSGVTWPERLAVLFSPGVAFVIILMTAFFIYDWMTT